MLQNPIFLGFFLFFFVKVYYFYMDNLKKFLQMKSEEIKNISEEDLKNIQSEIIDYTNKIDEIYNAYKKSDENEGPKTAAEAREQIREEKTENNESDEE